jgi:hypothetical protein
VFALGAPFKEEENEMINIFSVDQRIYIAFVIYAMLHAAAFWGAIFFEKMHFIKTSFVVFAVALILVIINQPLVRSLVNENVYNSVPFLGVSGTENGYYFHLVPDKSVVFYCMVVFVFIVVLLWTSAFFRLKEKEV